MLAGQRARQVKILLCGGTVFHQERADHDDPLVGRPRDAEPLTLFNEDQQLVRRQPHATMGNRPARRGKSARVKLCVPVLALCPAHAMP